MKRPEKEKYINDVTNLYMPSMYIELMEDYADHLETYCTQLEAAAEKDKKFANLFGDYLLAIIESEALEFFEYLIEFKDVGYAGEDLEKEIIESLNEYFDIAVNLTGFKTENVPAPDVDVEKSEDNRGDNDCAG